VEVLDDGPGVSAEAERHLFEPFFTTKPPGRGTGLGLYTSYALAKSLAGDLSLGNRRERGAVAAFILPPTKHRA
jgi:C4-dicarboxylate-specific signal transduction histidine kinase